MTVKLGGTCPICPPAWFRHLYVIKDPTPIASCKFDTTGVLSGADSYMPLKSILKSLGRPDVAAIIVILLCMITMNV